jgi:hypothetical protein
LVESLKSAYELRNSVAHGGSGNRGLSGVLALFDAAKDVVDILELSVT